MATSLCRPTVRPETRDFRLFLLLPGSWQSPIRCELSAASLRDQPVYEAISYTWGHPDDTKNIYVNDSIMRVPSNLEEALQHLRKTDESLILWADKICINQDDATEKRHQVAMMGEIFRSCSCTYFWLGMPSEETMAADVSPFFFFLHYSNNRHIADLPCFEQSPLTGEWSFVKNDLFDSIWLAFRDLCSKPWWSRLWVVQEVLLPPKGIVVFGKWRAPWEPVRQSIKKYSEHLSGCCSSCYQLFPDEYIVDFDTNATHHLHHSVADVDKMLRMFRHKLCRDPRDMIYGLLGLIGSSGLFSIKPDYTLGVDETFFQVMEILNRHSKRDLRYFTGLGFNSQRHGLPSWVRDFATPSDAGTTSQEILRYEAYSLYDAAASTKSNLKWSNRFNLSITGVFVDRIQYVGLPVQNRNTKHIGEVLLSWHKYMKSECTRKLDSPSLSQEQVFWRIVMADVFSIGEGKWRRILSDVIPAKITSGDTKDLATWISNIRKTFVRAGEPPFIWKSLVAATCGRSFCRTENDNIGLCFPTSIPGDEIWVLHGGRVPFILRPCPDNNTVGDASHYNLIGEAFLYGFMDGEALQGECPVKEVVLK